MLFFFFLMKCSFVKKTTSVSFYIWKGYNSFFFFFLPPSLCVWIACWCTLELNNPFWCHPDLRGLEGRLSLPPPWRPTSHTCRTQRDLGSGEPPRPRLHFHEGADSDATHISLHGVSLSVTSAPRSHVGNVENSCLYIGAFLEKKKKKKRQEVRSSPWPQLPSRVLPSGSYDDPFHSLLIL